MMMKIQTLNRKVCCYFLVLINIQKRFRFPIVTSWKILLQYLLYSSLLPDDYLQLLKIKYKKDSWKV